MRDSLSPKRSVVGPSEAIFTEKVPEIVGNNYLVIGTLEKTVWKRGTQHPLTLQEMLEALHDFKDVVTFKLTGGWVSDEKQRSAKSEDVQA